MHHADFPLTQAFVVIYIVLLAIGAVAGLYFRPLPKLQDGDREAGIAVS